MRRTTRLAGSLFFSLLLSAAALAQGGGGFGGSVGGGFGGASAGGAFGGGSNNDGGGTQAQAAFDPETHMPGRWRIEFRIVRDSSDSDASGRWITVDSEITLSGNRVLGRIRDTDADGEYECVISPEGRCEPGRLRFTTDKIDWQEFGFEIDDLDNEVAEGWATFVDPDSGVTREYELVLRKR